VGCSVDLLIVEALEIAAKMRLRQLVFSVDSLKPPLLQLAPRLLITPLIV